MRWTEKQRRAALGFLERVQPNNAAILVSNLEDFMPKQWRDGFEAMFAILEAPQGPTSTLLPGPGESAR